MANLQSYTMTTWENGQVITAALLNKIEQNLEDVINAVLGMANEVSSNELNINNQITGDSSGNLAVSGKITAGNNNTDKNKVILEIKGRTETNGDIRLTGAQGTNDNSVAKKSYVDGKISEVNTTIIGISDELNNYQVKSITTANGGLTVDTNNGAVTISLKLGDNLTTDDDGKLNAADTTYSVANQSTAGLMSAADKAKLDGAVTSIQINDKIPSTPANDGTVNISVPTSIKINDTTTINAGSNGTTFDLSGAIPDISNKFDTPTLPSSNGTYTLQLTLTNGTPTYAWVAIGGD